MRRTLRFIENASYSRMLILCYIKNLLKNGYEPQGLANILDNLMTFDEKLDFTDKMRVLMQNEGQYEEKDINHHFGSQEECNEDIMMLSMSHIQLRKYGIKVLPLLLDNLIQSAKQKDFSAENEPFNQISDIFGLSDIESDIIRFIFHIFTQNSYNISRHFNDEDGSNVYSFLSAGLDISFREVLKAVNIDGKLVRTGILFTGMYSRGRNLRRGPLSLDDSINDYLMGISDTDSLMNNFIRRDFKNPLPINDFLIPAGNRKMVQSLIKTGKPLNILFHGIAGTGKTEFARSIIKSCGRNPLWVFNNNNKGNRRLALMAAANIAGKDDVVCVDEADFLLNTGYFQDDSVDKGWLNQFLDDNKVQILWITNEIGCMEESLLRRFTYSLKFDRFDKDQRARIWKNILKDHPLKGHFTPAIISKLSTEYKVNAAGIASSLDALNALSSGKILNRKTIVNIISDFMEKHEELILGKPHNTSIKQKVRNDRYDPRFLNTNFDTSILLRALKTANDSIQEGKEVSGANILFYGDPGTGKTGFAKFIGKTLKTEVLFKRYSDLESKYLGETEQNISAAFREAERKKCILFIDEADSFFVSRKSAEHSWESSRTNEMLTQMDNFNGILICCTNLKQALDSAVFRRFHLKIEFKPVLKDQRVALYKKYFVKGKKALTEDQMVKIEAMDNLTPGDIYAVSVKTRFIDPRKLTHDAIILELENELKHKPENTRVLGF